MDDDIALDLVTALNKVATQLEKQNERLERLEIVIKQAYGG